MHHIKGNLYAARLNERGDVRLVKLTSQAGTREVDFDKPLPPQIVAVDTILDAGTFAALVVAVSARGDDYKHTHYHQVLANHQKSQSAARRYLDAIVSAYNSAGEYAKARAVESMGEGDLHRAIDMLLADYVNRQEST